MNYTILIIILIIISYIYIIFFVSLFPIRLFIKRKKSVQVVNNINIEKLTVSKKPNIVRIYYSQLINGYLRYFIFNNSVIHGKIVFFHSKKYIR